MHADEETKHSQEQGPSSTICLSSSHPSWTRFVWQSGALIGQQASFKQSVHALRCRPWARGLMHIQDQGQVQVRLQTFHDDDGIVILKLLLSLFDFLPPQIPCPR